MAKKSFFPSKDDFSALKQWKSFFKDFKHPSTNVSSVLKNLLSLEELEFKNEIREIFVEAVKVFPNDSAKIFAFCCQISGISILENNEVPVKKDLDFEFVLRDLLESLHGLEIKVDFAAKINDDQTFLEYLTKVGNFLTENAFPIPITQTSVDCVRFLLQIHAGSLENQIGFLSALILFNVDGVNIENYFQDLISTYFKLRQLPKLIAKIFIALEKPDFNSEFKNLSPKCIDAFEDHICQLPFGQIFELWKSFNFHLKSKKKIVVGFVDDLMSAFLRSVCLIDHKVPGITCQKIAEFIKQTHEILKESKNNFAETRKELIELALMLKKYRKRQDLENLFQNVPKNSTIAKKIKICDQIEDLSSMEVDEVVENFAFAKCDLNKDEIIEATESLFKSPSDFIFDQHLIEENVEIQKAIIINLIKFLEDRFDVDGGCEVVIKRLKSGKFLQNNDEESKKKVIEKVISALEEQLLSAKYSVNPDLDPKSYFLAPIRALNSLPLECLQESLNLTVIAILLMLISVCSHEEVVDDLIGILARCFDPVLRQSQFLRIADGSKLLLFMSRMKHYSLKSKNAESTQFLLTQSVVRYISDYAEKWSNFDQNFTKICDNLKNPKQCGQRSVLTAVLFAEALEKPLIFQDASEKKLKNCGEKMKLVVKNLKSGLSDFDEADEDMKILLMRCTSAVLVLKDNKITKHEIEKVLKFALICDSKHAINFLKTVFAKKW